MNNEFPFDIINMCVKVPKRKFKTFENHWNFWKSNFTVFEKRLIFFFRNFSKVIFRIFSVPPRAAGYIFFTHPIFYFFSLQFCPPPESGNMRFLLRPKINHFPVKRRPIFYKLSVLKAMFFIRYPEVFSDFWILI